MTTPAPAAPTRAAVRVKICGITSIADAEVAARAGADALGFVLAPSKRQVTLEDAVAIARALPPFLARVAVLVNPSEEEARRVALSAAFTHLQFHGHETPAFCASMPLPVLKAFRLCEPEELALMEEFLRQAPLVLPLADGPAGGSGRVCNWELARRMAAHRSLVLAGGLTPANVAEAIRTVRPSAVDVSGGVESSPGRKDAELVRAFIGAAKEG